MFFAIDGWAMRGWKREVERQRERSREMIFEMLVRKEALGPEEGHVASVARRGEVRAGAVFRECFLSH